MTHSQFSILNSQLRTAAAAALVFLAPSAGWSQDSPPASVAFDPIRCWWRTSAPAVRTGESFSVMLTCATLDTPDARAVVAEDKLAVAVIAFAPFEVVGGSRAADILTPARRFFQYEYVLRAISPDLIGQDVPLPLLEVGYRVESRLPDNSAQVGRDLTYLMPPLKVRVVSMVPNDADDIRDSTTERFAQVETLRSRASLLRIVAFGLLALGGVMTILTIASLVARARRSTTRQAPLLSDRALVNAASRELNEVRRQAEGSWTEALVSRAAAAARVVGAAALGRTISQSPAAGDIVEPEGGLIARHPGRPRRRWVVSSPVTAADLERGLQRLPPAAASRRTYIEALRSALATFTSAQYSTSFVPDRTTLDQALERAIDAARHLKPSPRSPVAWFRHWTGAPAPEAHR